MIYNKCINSFLTRFDYGEGKDTATRELKFTQMPPVLHITLNRFNFNPKTQTVQKNNSRFEFYSKLDLSPLLSNAKYTLHSVLGKPKSLFTVTLVLTQGIF